MISFDEFIFRLNEVGEATPEATPSGTSPATPDSASLDGGLGGLSGGLGGGLGGGGGLGAPPGGMGGSPPSMGGGDSEPVQPIEINVKDIWKLLKKSCEDMEQYPELNVEYFEKQRKEDYQKARKNSLIS